MQTEVQADGGGCFRSIASPGRVVVSSCRSVTWRRDRRKAARDRHSDPLEPRETPVILRPLLSSVSWSPLYLHQGRWTLTWKTCHGVEALPAGAGAFPSWRIQ